MKTHVIIFEARGGSDKGKYGYRNDSKPIIDALQKRGWTAEIIFYTDENRGEIYRYTLEKASAYISRVNPGNLRDETGYFQMLRELVWSGIEALPHPDAMINYGAKSAVAKLKNTDWVPEDVFLYDNFDDFKARFPYTLKYGVRVIKQNRGSTGEGIWRVEVIEPHHYEGQDFFPPETRLKLTEAVDNHSEEKSLEEFMDFCIQYLEGINGSILEMPFLARISEGEIRVLMLRDEIIHIVHKRPQTAEAFSATLFSGAHYTYESPDNWTDLVEVIKKNLKQMQYSLGNYDLPLIWTADFILDTDENGKDKYVLGEINASCVGFTTHLELSENIADEILNLMEAEGVVNQRWPAYTQ